jgi:two-component system sensor histidine kinase DegS
VGATPTEGRFQTANGADADAPTYAGLQESAVQDLYDAAGRVMRKQLESLRRLERDATGRLRAAALEVQQLERFLDEVHYRERYVGDLLARAAESEAALLRQQYAATQAQAERLTARLAALRRAQARLEQLHTRLGWLVQQLELSAERMAGSDDEGDPWALVMRAQLIQGQEVERTRLAREIHDGPAQVLTNTLLRLQLCEQLVAQHPDEALTELARLRGAVREGLRDVRRFLFNLRPASLSEVGLVTTLRRLVQDTQDQGTLTIGAVLPEQISLSPDQEMAVFRIIQEALHNIIKHAAATHVDLAFARQSEGGWEITIADNGRGFDLEAAATRVGSGLVSMRERAVIIGGTLDLTSRPGYGTKLTLTIPATAPESAGHWAG